MHFASASATIDAEHVKNVRDFADFLKKYPSSRGIIEGNCDCDGPESVNAKLAEQRSRSVADMLVNIYGIGAERLSVESFGEKNADANSTDESGKADDRNVRMVGTTE